MKTSSLWVCALLVAGGMSSFSKAAVVDEVPLKLQSYQVREFEVPKEEAFNSALTVLQDLGYIIDYAEVRTGLIRARSLRRSIAFVETRETEVNIFVTQPSHRKSRVRLTFYRSVGLGSDARFDVNEAPIGNTVVYEKFFARMQQDFFTERHVRIN